MIIMDLVQEAWARSPGPGALGQKDWARKPGPAGLDQGPWACGPGLEGVWTFRRMDVKRDGQITSVFYRILPLWGRHPKRGQKYRDEEIDTISLSLSRQYLGLNDWILEAHSAAHTTFDTNLKALTHAKNHTHVLTHALGDAQLHATS